MNERCGGQSPWASAVVTRGAASPLASTCGPLPTPVPVLVTCSMLGTSCLVASRRLRLCESTLALPKPPGEARGRLSRTVCWYPGEARGRVGDRQQRPLVGQAVRGVRDSRRGARTALVAGDSSDPPGPRPGESAALLFQKAQQLSSAGAGVGLRAQIHVSGPSCSRAASWRGRTCVPDGSDRPCISVPLSALGLAG